MSITVIILIINNNEQCDLIILEKNIYMKYSGYNIYILYNNGVCLYSNDLWFFVYLLLKL